MNTTVLCALLYDLKGDLEKKDQWSAVFTSAACTHAENAQEVLGGKVLGLGEGDLTSIFSLVKDPRRGNLPEDTSTQPRKTMHQWDDDPVSSFVKELGAPTAANAVDRALLALEVHYGNTPSKQDNTLSVCDAAKMRAAVAACLAGNEEAQGSLEDEKPFQLICGDISGIQDFIFTISSKKALKSMKARSLYFELFTEHCVCFLLHKMALTHANVVYAAGGKFLLLAPNVEKTNIALQTVRSSVSGYLKKSTNAQVRLNLESVPSSTNDLLGCKEAWDALEKKLSQAKRQPLKETLADLLGPPQVSKAVCGVCARQDIPTEYLSKHDNNDVYSEDEETQACKPCGELAAFGGILQKHYKAVYEDSKLLYIHIYDNPTDNSLEINTEGHQRWYAPSNERSPSNKVIETLHCNCWDANDLVHNGRQFLTSTYHAIKSIQDAAKNGLGMNMAGVLRMDVDFLGEIFGTCLTRQSLMHRAALSRRMSIFFKYHLDEVLQRKKNLPAEVRQHEGDYCNLANQTKPTRELTVIYSGGDDLLLFGHWLDTLEAAMDIRQAFGAYTKNPGITLSGGLAAVSPKAPIYQTYKEAGKAESAAKRYDVCSITEKARKNSFAFGENLVISWDDINAVTTRMRNVRDLLATSGDKRLTPAPDIGMGFLFKLMQTCREHAAAQKGRRGARQGKALLIPLYVTVV